MHQFYQCHYGKLRSRLAVAMLGLIPLFLLEAEMVSAATFTYDLVDVEFGSGGVATGFFEIDELGAVLSGEIKTTPGSKPVFSGATYTDLNAQLFGPLFYLSSDAPGPTPYFYRLFLTVNAAKLGSPQIETRDFTLFEGARFGSASGFTVGERIALLSDPGKLVIRTGAAAVPEPFTVFGSTLALGAGFFLRKRARNLGK